MATSSILKQARIDNDRSAKIVLDVLEYGEPMIEIMGCEGLSNAFSDLGIPATKTASSQDGRWEVWELPHAHFKALCDIKDEDWKESWGWWRHAVGSNMDAVEEDYIIHGRPIKAWDGVIRSGWHKEYCVDCDDNLENQCDASDESICYCYHDRKYPDMLEYLAHEIGASTETNVTALCIDLAKQNGMTLAELVSNYM